MVGMDAVRMTQLDLCRCAAEGSAAQVDELLAKRADPNWQNYEKRTALHAAVSHGHSDAVRVLLDHKANPNIADFSGATPLDEAERGNRFELENLLLRSGARVLQENLLNQATRARWAVPRSEVTFGEILGETLKSKVSIGEWRGTKVVAKRLLNNSTEQEDRDAAQKELLNEIKLLQSLRHPDLVMFLGASLERNEVVLFTEFMEGGDLDSYYAKKRKGVGGIWRPHANRLLHWGTCVARALCFLHNSSVPIVHRDLKPLNLLLTGDAQHVKVTDFGISTTLVKTEAACPKMTGGVGSWRYMAPEVVRHQAYTEKADIYSFALVLFFMSAGKIPFYSLGQGSAETVLKEYQSGREPRPNLNDCHGQVRGIMSSAWHVDHNKRPSASELTQRLSSASARAKAGCATM